MRQFIDIVKTLLRENNQNEIAVLIDRVRDSFIENSPYDALEWMIDAGYTVQDSPELKALFDSNIRKISKMIIDEIRQGDADYHVYARIREMIEDVGIEMPNDQIAQAIYNVSDRLTQTLNNMVDDGKFLDAVRIAIEFSNWGLEVRIDDFLFLDEKQIKKTIIKALIDEVSQGRHNKQDIIDLIGYIRDDGYDYPEFEVILSQI